MDDLVIRHYDTLLVLWYVMLLLWCRHLLVAAHRNRRLAEIHTYNMQLVFAGEYAHVDMSLYARIGSPMQMVLDFSRWTYRQFYPRTYSSAWAMSFAGARAARERMNDQRLARQLQGKTQ